jgi:hypothetical protein
VPVCRCRLPIVPTHQKYAEDDDGKLKEGPAALALASRLLVVDPLLVGGSAAWVLNQLHANSSVMLAGTSAHLPLKRFIACGWRPLANINNINIIDNSR